MTYTPPDPRDTTLVKGYLAALILSGDPKVISRAYRLFGGRRLTAVPQLQDILEEIAATAREGLPVGAGQVHALALRLSLRHPLRGDADSWLAILQQLMELPAVPTWISGWMEKKLLHAVVQVEAWKLGERASHGHQGDKLLRDLEKLTDIANSADCQDPAEPSLICMADVATQAVDWIWSPYLPLGKPTFLEGDPGLGKSWLATNVCAVISRGWAFPDSDGVQREIREPRNVIYLTAEDGLGDTLRPRLEAAGADLNRVFTLPGREVRNPHTGKKQLVGVTLDDLPEIEAALISTSAVLIVIDPIQAYLRANVDMWRANEIRAVLSGLTKIAEQYRCTPFCIRHLNKDAKMKALYRGLGSIDFAASARSILQVGQDPRHPNRRVIFHIKSNLAPAGPSLGFELRDGQFFWTGPSDLKPSDINRHEGTQSEKSALKEAIEFLTSYLSDGPQPAEEILKQAKKVGISESTLERARFNVGVHSQRLSTAGQARGAGKWMWSFTTEEPKDPTPPSVEVLEKPLEPPHSKDLQADVQEPQMSPLNEQPNLFDSIEVTANLQEPHQGESGPDAPGKDDDSELI